MAGTCYTGCTPTTIITHAPHVTHTLAFTGFDLAGHVIAGLVIVLVGLLAIVADRRRRGGPGK